MNRRVVGRLLMAGCALGAAVIVGLSVVRLSEAQAVSKAQAAEVERVRNALLRSAEAAERAALAATSAAQRQAQKDAALREFQAAEAEMRARQTLAKQARDARSASAAQP